MFEGLSSSTFNAFFVRTKLLMNWHIIELACTVCIVYKKEFTMLLFELQGGPELLVL